MTRDFNFSPTERVMIAMDIDDAKKKFIRKMDDIHSNIMYPKFYFGCLMAIISESEPVTQERIMELTGYSRGYVSLTLKQLQMNLPIRTIKKPGKRKKFITYAGSPVSYLLDLLSSRIMKPDFDSSFLSGIASELDHLRKIDDNAERFNDFVHNLILHDEIHREIREIALQELGHAFKVGSFLKNVLTFKLDKEVATFFTTFDENRVDFNCTRDMVKTHTAKYTQLKDEYFQSFRETLSPLFRASANNYSLVLHEVLIEECSTQESIEKSTKLPQSTISELLKQLIGEGYIAKKRIKGHRRVLYYPKASLTSLILLRFDRLDRYSSMVLASLDDILDMIENSKSKDVEEFRSILGQIKMRNIMLQQYSDRMRNLSKQKIYEKYQEGFRLI